MDCKEFREILDLYVDEELSPEAFAAAHIHLSDCHACRRAESTLLKLRSNLKLTVSQHQPPPDLVRAIRGITQPRWRKGLGSTHGTAATQISGLFWRSWIRLPVPVFAVLLIAMITFGLLFMSRVFRPVERARNVSTTTQPERGQSSVEAGDFSQFDHGGRASLYKLPRQ